MQKLLRSTFAAGTLASLSLSAAHAAVLQTYDFEGGGLAGWNVISTGIGDDLAFANGRQSVQPTGYDNGTIQGDWIIRTWDANNGVNPQTDGNTGAIRTDPFTLANNATIDFLIGGGKHPWGATDPDSLAPNIAAFNLEREVGPGDWETIFTATCPSAGGGQNLLSPASWDASAFAGETVRFGIYDTHSGGWGHIDVDNIVLSGDPIPEPSSLGLFGLLGGLLILRRRR